MTSQCFILKSTGSNGIGQTSETSHSESLSASKTASTKGIGLTDLSKPKNSKHFFDVAQQNTFQTCHHHDNKNLRNRKTANNQSNSQAAQQQNTARPN
jgi:hypothetical protein